MTFLGSGPSDQVGDLIGGVTVSTAARGVPEPSTWAMIALGFAALGFAGYRSRRPTAMFSA